MATRLNKKFILILTGVIMILGVAVAGVAYVAISGDADRQIRMGQEAEAIGDIEEALDRYGRAISKDPMNLSHYNDFERMLLKVKPSSRVDAREKYNQFLGILIKRKNVSVDNPASWERLINEFRRRAVLMSAGGGDPWMDIQDQSERMVSQFENRSDSESVAAAERAKGYLLQAMSKRIDLLKPQELIEYEALCKSMTDAGTTDPLVWEAVLGQRISEALRHQAKGDIRLLNRSISDEGGFDPLFARMTELGVEMTPELYGLQALRLRMGGEFQGSDAEFQAMYARFKEDVDALIDEIQSLDDSVNNRTLHDTLRRVILANVLTAEDAVEAIVPLSDTGDLKLDMAMVLFQNVAQSSPDQAERLARYTLAAEPLTVGLIAMIQPVARQQAAISLFDSIYAKVVAETEGFSIVDLKVAREEALVEFAGDPLLDEVMRYMDGSIALFEEDYVTARSKLSEIANGNLVRSSFMQRRFTPRFVAASLMSGERGVAIKNLQEYVEDMPPTAVLGIRNSLARELASIGRLEDARAEIENVLSIDPENEEAIGIKALLDKREMDMATNATGGFSASARAYARASAALAEGRFDDARVVLRDAVKTFEDDMMFKRMLITVETLLGNNEEAISFARTIDGYEDDEVIQRQIAYASVNDPIERINQIVEMSGDDEASKNALKYLYTMDIVAQGQEGSDVALGLLPALFEEAISSMSPNRSLRQRVLFATSRNTQYLSGVDSPVDRAFAALQEVEPDEAVAVTTKARLSTMMGNHSEALEILIPLTERGLDNAESWYTRSLAYEGLGRTQDALESMSKAVSRAPDRAEFVVEYAALLEASGDQDKALELLRSARRSDAMALLVRDPWLVAESAYGDQRQALTQRLSIYNSDIEESASGREVINNGNALELSRLLLVVPVERQDIRVDGKVRFSPAAWSGLKSQARRELISRERAARRKYAFDVIGKVDELADEKSIRDSLRLVRAQAHLLSDDRISALAELDGLIECCDETLEIAQRYRLIDMLQEFDRVDDATRQFELIAETEDPAALRELAIVAARSGRAEIAHEACTRLYATTVNSDDAVLYIQSLLNMSDLDEAEKILDELISGERYASDSDFQYQCLLIDGNLQALRGRAAIDEAIQLEKDVVVLEDAGKSDEARQASANISALIETTKNRFERGVAAIREAQALYPGRLLPFIRLHELLRSRVILLKNSAVEADLLANGRAARELSPADWRAVRCLMESHMVMGNPREAMSVIDQYFRNGGMSESARDSLMSIARIEGKTGLAIPPFERAMDRDPANPEWPRAIAKMLVESGNKEGASDMWWKVIELDSSTAAVTEFIELEFETDDFNIARVTEAFSLQPSMVEEFPRLKAAYAAVLYKQGEIRRAERMFDEAYKNARDAKTSGRDMLSVDKTLVYFKHVYPNDTLQQAEARLVAMSGNDMWANDYNALSSLADGEDFEDMNLPEAIRYLTLAKEKSESDPIYRRAILDRLSRHYYLDGNCEGAVDALQEIVDMGGAAPPTLNNLAYMMYDCKGDAAGAVYYSTQALQASPASPIYLDTHGVILMAMGQLEDAERYLSRAVSIKASPANLLHYAQLMHETDRDDEAGILLEKIGKDFPVLPPDVQGKVNALIAEID